MKIEMENEIRFVEEENRVLKKALELACYETDNYWNEKKAFDKNMTLCDYFIQQAKESEKDERD